MASVAAKAIDSTHPVVGVHAHLDCQHLPLLHRLEDGPVAVGRAVPVFPLRLVLLRVSCGRGVERVQWETGGGANETWL